MIRNLAVGIVMALCSGHAVADLAGVGRAGFLGGIYDAELSGQLGGQPAQVDLSETSMGLFAGYTFAMDSFFADIAVEYQSTSRSEGGGFDRTDVLPSVGMFLPGGLSLQLGYRLGLQGNDLFDDSFYQETGPFAGLGLPAISLVGDYELSPSVGFNLTTFDFDGTSEDADFYGLSARAAVSKPGSPHTFGLRLQRFEDREDGLKFIESYVHLFYQVSFGAFSR